MAEIVDQSFFPEPLQVERLQAQDLGRAVAYAFQLPQLFFRKELFEFVFQPAVKFRRIEIGKILAQALFRMFPDGAVRI